MESFNLNKVIMHNDVRQNNLQKVFNFFLEEDCFCADIAKKLNISKTASKMIVSELIEMNLLIPTDTIETNNIGRKPIMYTINRKKGYFIFLDFSDINVKTCLIDFCGNKLWEESEKVLPLNQEKIENKLNKIKEQIVNHYYDKNIIGIGISTPGIIDDKTGYFIYAPRFENYKSINLYNTTKKYFDVPVYIRNDIKLSLEGEIFKGVLKNVSDCIYIHIDKVIGGTLLVKNQIMDGELGLYKCNDEKGNLVNIGEFNFRELKKKISNLLDKEISYDEMFDIIDSGNNKEITKICEFFVKQYVGMIYNISTILNIHTVVFEGKSIQEHLFFYDEVKKMISFIDNKEKNYKFYFNKLGSESSIIGLQRYCVKQTVKQIFQDRYLKTGM